MYKEKPEKQDYLSNAEVDIRISGGAWHKPELHKSLLRDETNNTVGPSSDGSAGRGTTGTPSS